MILFFRSARTVRASSSGLSSTNMITLFFKGRSLAHDFGEGKIENCSAIDFAFRPDAPSMTLDDPLHGSQADAGAREFAGGVQPLECSEQSVGIGSFKASTVVSYEENQGAGDLSTSEFDVGHGSLRREFPSVAQQIFECDARQTRVRRRGEALLNVEFDLTFGLGRAQIVCDRAGECADIEALDVHTSTGYL